MISVMMNQIFSNGFYLRKHYVLKYELDILNDMQEYFSRNSRKYYHQLKWPA